MEVTPQLSGHRRLWSDTRRQCVSIERGNVSYTDSLWEAKTPQELQYKVGDILKSYSPDLTRREPFWIKYLSEPGRTSTFRACTSDARVGFGGHNELDKVSVEADASHRKTTEVEDFTAMGLAVGGKLSTSVSHLQLSSTNLQRSSRHIQRPFLLRQLELRCYAYPEYTYSRPDHLRKGNAYRPPTSTDRCQSVHRGWWSVFRC